MGEAGGRRRVLGVLGCPAVLVLQRATVVTAGMVAAYFCLPLDRPLRSAASTATVAAGLAAVASAVVWQVRLIRRAPMRRLQALEAFALTVPAFLLAFSTVYFGIEHTAARSFNERLSRSDALYFTVSVFSSVGFGDIVPRSQPARLVVTAQMICDLALLGAAARFVLDAVRDGLHRK
jgi:hypothetical protein